MPLTVRRGTTSIVALHDATGFFPEPREAVLPAARAEQWAEADRREPAAVTADGRWRLAFRCFAVRAGDGRTILVDTGVGPADSPAADWAPVPGRLPDELAAAGIDPAAVTAIVLTHAHTDHIGWAVTGEPGRPYFPNARYLLQRAEVAAICERGDGGVGDHLLDPLERTGLLDVLDGAVTLAPGLRVVPTPGHTPGHQSVLLDDPDQPVLFTGDLLVHVVQLIDPDLAYAYEADQTTARDSRTALLRGLAGRSAVLATPHLAEPFTPVDQ